MIGECSHGFAVPRCDILRVVRDDLNPYPAIREMHDSDDAGFMNDGLRALLVRETMRDGDMPVAFGIDTRHLTAEELTVRRGVAKLVDGNVIMNHLMEDRVFDEGFRKVNTDVDTEHEILVAVPTEEALLAAGKGYLAEEAFGMGELDGNRRKGPAEIAGIELVKAGLDIGNRWFQFKISNLRFKN